MLAGWPVPRVLLDMRLPPGFIPSAGEIEGGGREEREGNTLSICYLTLTASETSDASLDDPRIKRLPEVSHRLHPGAGVPGRKEQTLMPVPSCHAGQP